MGMHRIGWFSYLSYDDKQSKPAITPELQPESGICVSLPPPSKKQTHFN